MITRRKLLLGGLLVTGGVIAGDVRRIASADTERKVNGTTNGAITGEVNGAKFEAAVIGGGFAGLQAALTLGRACRKVVLFDNGKPRNDSGRPFHNFLGEDGVTQADFFRQVRLQLKNYDLTICGEKVTAVKKTDAGFELTTGDGTVVTSTKVLYAGGVKDELPAIKDIGKFWGKGVYFCPFCSGWEVRGQPLAVFGQGESVATAALTLTGWSKNIVLLDEGNSPIYAETQAKLKKHGIEHIELIKDKIEALSGDTELQSITLASGRVIRLAGLFLQPGEDFKNSILSQLGVHVSPFGLPILHNSGETSVPGFYIAGDASGKAFQAIGAAADGATVAYAVSRALILEAIQFYPALK
jgi:thioredoxin reductase